jgi:hypothetical protein
MILMGGSLRVHVHRTELVDPEFTPHEPDTFLPEENRTGRNDFDDCADDEKERQQGREGEQKTGQIQQPLGNWNFRSRHIRRIGEPFRERRQIGVGEILGHSCQTIERG